MKKILVAAAIAAAACGCVSVNQNDGGNACRRPCIAKDIVHEKFRNYALKKAYHGHYSMSIGYFTKSTNQQHEV